MTRPNGIAQNIQSTTTFGGGGENPRGARNPIANAGRGLAENLKGALALLCCRAIPSDDTPGGGARNWPTSGALQNRQALAPFVATTDSGPCGTDQLNPLPDELHSKINDFLTLDSKKALAITSKNAQKQFLSTVTSLELELADLITMLDKYSPEQRVKLERITLITAQNPGTVDIEGLENTLPETRAKVQYLDLSRCRGITADNIVTLGGASQV